MKQTSTMTSIRGDFIDVSIIRPSEGPDNSNKYTIFIKTHSQPMLLGKKETNSISFTLVGDMEFNEFLDSLAELTE